MSGKFLSPFQENRGNGTLTLVPSSSQEAAALSAMVVSGKAVATIAAGGSFMALLQTMPIPEAGVIGQFERLGLVGVLICAVVVLWRKLDTKDTLLTESQVTMAKAFVANTDMMRELKDSVESLHGIVERLVTVREVLNQANQQGSRHH